MKALIGVYLVAMVRLVRMQIKQMQEKEEVVGVVVADIRGKTDMRFVDELIFSGKEVLM